MAKAGKGPAAIVDGAKKFVTGFGGFTAGQKAVVLAVVAGLVLGGVYFARWASTPSYAPLFSNLSGTDASAITQQLDASNVKYELQDGGSTILVPQDVVDAQRLAMAGQGLPANTENNTSSLLESGSVTQSEFLQNKKYQAYLAGELQDTITSIDGVQSSKVNLAIPDKDVFLNEQDPTTASVLVKLRPGTTLSSDQVTSIVNLVARGVPGMNPKDVSVVDGEGNTLSSDGNGASANAERTNSYNASETAKLQAYLEGIYGKGNVSALVSATLDFDQQTEKSIKYSQPQQLSPTSESEAVEKYSGSGQPTTGVLGPDNIQTPAGTTGTDGAYEKSQTTKNNPIDSTETNTVSTPGAVQRQSVVVTLDATKLGNADVNQVTQMVTNAIGVDAARGDTVSVVKTAFNTGAADAAAKELAASEKADQQQQLIGYGKTAALALLVLVMLIVILVSFRRRKVETVETLDLAAPPIDLGDITDGDEAPALPAQRRPAPVALDPAPVDPALQTAAARRDEVVQLVARQPDEVAELLRGWLADRRS
ncbi:flagellar basal-body MS-ring/collar protein FliF [Kineococcus gynurae]|uniref:Flagellar M-ring protein n=1 Tax=Kineococcus gynurae TaxID=452979 RepID=A0ABV5LR74_9ACTN